MHNHEEGQHARLHARRGRPEEGPEGAEGGGGALGGWTNDRSGVAAAGGSGGGELRVRRKGGAEGRVDVGNRRVAAGERVARAGVHAEAGADSAGGDGACQRRQEQQYVDKCTKECK